MPNIKAYDSGDRADRTDRADKRPVESGEWRLAEAMNHQHIEWALFARYAFKLL